MLEGIWAVLIEECEELGGVTGNGSRRLLHGKARLWGALLDAIPRPGKAGAEKHPGRRGQVGH